MKRTKIVLLLTVFLILPILLTACGEPENAPPTSVSKTESGDISTGAGEEAAITGDLIIWSWSESEVKIYADNIKEKYPDLNLVYVPIDNGDVTMKLQVAAASGSEMPDIAYQEVGTRGALLAMDIWEDLSAEPYHFDESLVFEPLLNNMKDSQGRVVGIDREFNPSGLVYNRKLAEEYLGTSDLSDIEEICKDWDSFIEAGKQVLEKSDGKVYMLPGIDDLNWALNQQYSEPIFDGNTAKLTEFYTVVFEPMIKIRDAGIASVMHRWTPAWNASYNEGKSVFYQYAPWSYSAAIVANAPDTSGEWGVVKAPGIGFTMGGTAMGIPRGAQNKAGAWAFIESMFLETEGVAKNVDTLGYVASLQSFYDPIPSMNDEAIAFFGGQDPNKYLLENVAPEMTIRPTNEYDAVVNEVLNMVMDNIENDAALTLEDAVALAKEECRNKLPAEIEIK